MTLVVWIHQFVELLIEERLSFFLVEGIRKIAWFVDVSIKINTKIQNIHVGNDLIDTVDTLLGIFILTVLITESREVRDETELVNVTDRQSHRSRPFVFGNKLLNRLNPCNPADLFGMSRRQIRVGFCNDSVSISIYRSSSGLFDIGVVHTRRANIDFYMSLTIDPECVRIPRILNVECRALANIRYLDGATLYLTTRMYFG